MDTAQQALKIAPTIAGNRVLIIYSALADNRGSSQRDEAQRRQHRQGDPSSNRRRALTRRSRARRRATLARMAVAGSMFDKAIAALVLLVNQEPQWSTARSCSRDNPARDSSGQHHLAEDRIG
jgi:hypothetical protein